MVSAMAIILQESLRAVFYAPFYVALAHDAFAAEGVEIHFMSSPRPQDAALRLMDGTVDVCWGGPMRVMETYQKLPGCDIVCFAEVVTRDPFLLIGRAPRPEFKLADLSSLRLATVSEVPTPWMCLQHDLRLAGIDPDRHRPRRRSDDGENVAALKAGEVDVIQVFEPFPSLLLAEGGPSLVRGGTARADVVHHLLCTSRYADGATRRIATDGAGDRPRRTGLRDVGQRDRRSDRGLFPRRAAGILDAACTRYKALAIWNETPLLERAGYERLRESLVSGGFVTPGTAFETAVDNTLPVPAWRGAAAARLRQRWGGGVPTSLADDEKQPTVGRRLLRQFIHRAGDRQRLAGHDHVVEALPGAAEQPVIDVVFGRAARRPLPADRESSWKSLRRRLGR